MVRLSRPEANSSTLPSPIFFSSSKGVWSRQASDHAGVAGIHAHRKIKFHAGPVVGLVHGGVRGIGVAHVQVAIARAGIIVRVQNVAAKDGNARAVRRRSSFRDPHAAAALHVAHQIAFKRRGDRDQVRKDHERVLRELLIRRLAGADRVAA